MYLVRRDGYYYFRIGVPVAYRQLVGKSEIRFSLKTTNRREAQIKSLPFIEKYLLEFGNGCPTMKRSSRTVQIRKSITFSKVYEKYLLESKITEASERNFNTSVYRFIKIVGDKDIRLYNKNDIVEFKDTLLKFPANISEEDKLLSVNEIIKKHRNTKKKISSNMVSSRYLAVIKIIFNYAKDNDFIDSNPTEGVKVIGKRKEAGRLPFSLEQIRQNMLESDLFRHKQNDRKTEYRWLILLAIYSGARLEEMVRLRVDDVGEEDGIPYIFIQPHPEEGHLLKTASSRRRVPLHPQLMNKFDFSNFIKQRREDGGKYLFPLVNSGNVIAGKKGTQFSKWYARWLDKVGLNNPGLCFHSFRHTFKLWGRSAGVDIPLINALQGHHNAGVSFAYGRDAYGSAYPLKTLFEAVLKMEELGALGNK